MSKKTTKKIRCVFEKEAGNDIWWICYFADGRKHREKVGRKSDAIDLYRKRKMEVLQGKKLPEKLRARQVRFDELAEDAETYCKANNQGQQFDLYRIGRLKKEFGNHAGAAVTIEDLRKWFDEQEWQPGTYNRYKTTLSLIYVLVSKTLRCNRILRNFFGANEKTMGACVF